MLSSRDYAHSPPPSQQQLSVSPTSWNHIQHQSQKRQHHQLMPHKAPADTNPKSISYITSSSEHSQPHQQLLSADRSSKEAATHFPQTSQGTAASRKAGPAAFTHVSNGILRSASTVSVSPPPLSPIEKQDAQMSLTALTSVQSQAEKTPVTPAARRASSCQPSISQNTTSNPTSSSYRSMTSAIQTASMAAATAALTSSTSNVHKSALQHLATVASLHQRAQSRMRTESSSASPTIPSIDIESEAMDNPVLEDMDASATQAAGRKRKPPSHDQNTAAAFVLKVFNLLKQPEHSKYVEWNDEGDVFIIFHSEEFAEKVLPNYFKHKKFPSFVRQLNIYGFYRVSDARKSPYVRNKEACVFSHKFFLRDRPELLAAIKRRAPKKNSKSGNDDGLEDNGQTLPGSGQAGLSEQTTELPLDDTTEEPPPSASEKQLDRPKKRSKVAKADAELNNSTQPRPPVASNTSKPEQVRKLVAAYDDIQTDITQLDSYVGTSVWPTIEVVRDSMGSHRKNIDCVQKYVEDMDSTVYQDMRLTHKRKRNNVTPLSVSGDGDGYLAQDDLPLVPPLQRWEGPKLSHLNLPPLTKSIPLLMREPFPYTDTYYVTEMMSPYHEAPGEYYPHFADSEPYESDSLAYSYDMIPDLQSEGRSQLEPYVPPKHSMKHNRVEAISTGGTQIEGQDGNHTRVTNNHSAENREIEAGEMVSAESVSPTVARKATEDVPAPAVPSPSEPLEVTFSKGSCNQYDSTPTTSRPTAECGEGFQSVSPSSAGMIDAAHYAIIPRHTPYRWSSHQYVPLYAASPDACSHAPHPYHHHHHRHRHQHVLPTEDCCQCAEAVSCMCVSAQAWHPAQGMYGTHHMGHRPVLPYRPTYMAAPVGMGYSAEAAYHHHPVPAVYGEPRV
ncbi:HSF-type DNA-binding-domain-containing protein [Phlyctochytrium arcticum]|nr:HSF-type DNA-binding-domain-containing protein [Phlyctochytrium arcticum]